MSILIGRHEFEGPFASIDELREEPGLYAILHFEHNEYEIIHIAQGENIKERIELSPRTDTLARGKILLAACYTSCGRRERTLMLEAIQKEFFYDEEDSEKQHDSSEKKISMLDRSEASLSIKDSK